VPTAVSCTAVQSPPGNPDLYTARRRPGYGTPERKVEENHDDDGPDRRHAHASA